MTNNSLPLPPITTAKFRFELVLQKPAKLPPYLGSLLRGGFGLTFKRLVCMQPHLERCDDCLLLHTCAYPAVFRPAAPPGSDRLSAHQRIPVPYVLEPPPRRTESWPAGETLSFNLLLLGQGLSYLPYFILAFQQLGEKGLGRQRVPAHLAQVLAMRPHHDPAVPLWQGGGLHPNWRALGTWPTHQLPQTSNTGTSLTLRFLTPTRLKHQGTYVYQAPPFHVLFRTLLRRVSSLSYFFAGQVWNIDYRQWVDKAEQVQRTAADVQWLDWDRYSSRQQQRVNMGGLVGRVTYTAPASLGGDLSPFLPLLHLGELIHLGKGTAFGNGQYELLC